MIHMLIALAVFVGLAIVVYMLLEILFRRMNLDADLKRVIYIILALVLLAAFVNQIGYLGAPLALR